jgi:glycogen debranching enzyme
MTPQIKVGPPRLSIHQGYAVFVTSSSGEVRKSCQDGLFFLDTRLIETWSVGAEGKPWKRLNGGLLAGNAERVYLTNPAIPTAKNTIKKHTLGLVIGRHIDGGMHEDLEITNYGKDPAVFNFTVTVRNDFADLFEVKSKKITRRGKIDMEWLADEQQLVTTYHNEDFVRAIRITNRDRSVRMHYANGSFSFKINLEPGGVWKTCLSYDFANGDDWSHAPDQCTVNYVDTQSAKDRQAWQDEVLKVETSNPVFAQTYAQSVDDLASLRLPIDGTDHVKFVPAAGLPWFLALFGRDSLIISLQSSVVHPEFALGALKVLARWQATERDDYRDASPGKIHHELRRGELAHFHLIPQTPYYGSADATPLYLITLHSAWRTTGDDGVLKEHLKTAEGCLDWIDQYGDMDGDGFQEYETRSSAGLHNQAWKDSGRAVMNLDGSTVKAPKALCELQGYVYDAWLRMAQVYDVLGDGARATELRRKAKTLFEQFNDTFWMEDEGYYAYALDGDKKVCRSIASNPGQCLWSGIVPADRARRVADRLMKPDMWSGWGIRTLSADHTSFNPYYYQCGAVWPHDNGLIAQGFKRYGFHEEACRVAEAITKVAGFFEMDRLPELYAGVQQDGANFPVQYLGANVPQGWAAGSVFSLVQALIGFQPEGKDGKVYVDPHLPDWMPDLLVRDLQVGSQSFDIQFNRTSSGATDFHVTRGTKEAIVRRPMTEWAEHLAAAVVPSPAFAR